MYCKGCGKQLPDETKFCKYCGMDLSENTRVGRQVLKAETAAIMEENVKQLDENVRKEMADKKTRKLVGSKVIVSAVLVVLLVTVVFLAIKLAGDSKRVYNSNSGSSHESSYNDDESQDDDTQEDAEDEEKEAFEEEYEDSEQENHEQEMPSETAVNEPAEEVYVAEQRDVNSQNNEAEQQGISVDSLEMVKSLYESVEWQENSDMIQVYYETVIGDHTLYEGMYRLGDHGFDAPVGYTSITKAYGNLDGKEYLLWSSYYGSSGYFIDRIFIIDCDTLKVVEYLEETANGRFLGGLEKKSEEELAQYIDWINEAVYAPLGISEEQRQDISLFLSNFAEVHFCPADGANFNEDEMIEYAYWHHHKNSLNDIVYDTYHINYTDGTSEEAQLMGFSSGKIQSTTQWYFGKKVSHHQTGNLFYADDYYWFFAASGEMELTFAIARDVEKMDNGNINVWFSEFSITDFDASADGIYDLTYEQAKQQYFCKETNSGNAVLKIVDDGEGQRYNLVEFWLDGYPLS